VDITNEKTIARSTQAQIKPVDIPRGNGVVRGEGENVGGQQERDARTDSSQSSIFSPGTAIPGGMLDHVIDEYVDQVGKKREEISRMEDEVKRLENRIQEFKALRDEVKKQSEKLE
jgi:uncharacterized coiled-coil protein SlyX